MEQYFKVKHFHIAGEVKAGNLLYLSQWVNIIFHSKEFIISAI